MDDIDDLETPPPIINPDPAPMKAEPVDYYQIWRDASSSPIGPATAAKPESSSEHGTPHIKDEHQNDYSMLDANPDTEPNKSKTSSTMITAC